MLIVKQDGKQNTQSVRHIINNVGSLMGHPQDVSISAIKNFFWPYLLTASVTAGAFLFLEIYAAVLLGYTKEDSGNLTLAMIIIATGVGGIFSIESMQYIYNKFKWGHVKYYDRTIEYKNSKLTFDQIWRMSVKRTWYGCGLIEYFYIHPKTQARCSQKIIISKFADAQYLYDVFWSSRA